MARGRLYVGTSGFAYKEWKPGFYPAKLKAAEMLGFYARHLPSVEINNTFYRTPTPKLLEGWKAETPESFVFTLKAPRRITHIRRLRDPAESLEFFLSSARSLGPRLGCLLFQCPPNLRYDAERLDGFLAALPSKEVRCAMEFRHESWDDDAVRERLGGAGVARCFAHDDETETASIPRTAERFVYLRLRKPAYAPKEIDTWAARLRAILDDGADAYVYFKHEDDPAGIDYAKRLISLTG